jgi:hypothetical protein
VIWLTRKSKSLLKSDVWRACSWNRAKLIVIEAETGIPLIPAVWGGTQPVKVLVELIAS